MDFLELNGEILSKDSKLFSALHSGFYYGMSVYETCFVIEGKVAFWEEHVQRMKSSIEFINISIPENFFESLKNRIQNFVKTYPAKYQRLRIIFAPKDYPNSHEFDSLLLMQEISKFPESISLCIASIQKPYPNPLPSYLKLSANFYSTYSYREAKQKGFDEALLLTTNDLVAEGSYCNIFWIYKNECFTPSLSSSILEGVTRSKILEASVLEKIPIQEGEFPFPILEKANGVFISSSTRGLIPVSRLENKTFPNVAYEKVQKLQARYETMLQESLKKW